MRCREHSMCVSKQLYNQSVSKPLDNLLLWRECYIEF